jgi:hypothetical protein
MRANQIAYILIPESLNLYAVGEKVSNTKKPTINLLPEQEHRSKFQNKYKGNFAKISEEETCEK